MIRNFMTCLLLIVIGALLFGAVLKGLPGNLPASNLKQYDEYSLRDRGRYLLTENLIKNRSFALSREQAEIAAPDAGYYNGKWYELYPPGMSILAIPFYLLGEQYDFSLLGSFLLGGFFAIGILVFVFLIAKDILGLPYWASVLASLIFAFASTSLGYATSLFQHHASAFFIISSFYFVYQYKIHRRWGFIFAFYVWLSYGIVIWIDYPNAILMLPVMIYFTLSAFQVHSNDLATKVKFRFSILLTSVLFIGLILIHLNYNFVNFGSPIRLSGSLPGFREKVDKALDEGKVEDIKKASDKKSKAKFLTENNIANSSFQLLIAPDRGLFVYSPVFILAIFGIILSAKKKILTVEIGTLIAIILTVFFFYASWGDPYGGWAFGPRYLIPAMPALAIFVAYFLAQTKRKLVSKLIAFPLIVISASIAILGAVTTNAVPPEIEATHLKIDYGLSYNLSYLVDNKSSVFLYNYFAKDSMSLVNYYSYVLIATLVIFAFVLVMMPALAWSFGALRNWFLKRKEARQNIWKSQFLGNVQGA